MRCRSVAGTKIGIIFSTDSDSIYFGVFGVYMASFWRLWHVRMYAPCVMLGKVGK